MTNQEKFPVGCWVVVRKIADPVQIANWINDEVFAIVDLRQDHGLKLEASEILCKVKQETRWVVDHD